MKAQKAASAVMTAYFAACCISAAMPFQAEAEEKEPVTALALDRTAADTDGHFTSTLSLEELPQTGLCALEFAIAYDSAALEITDVKLLYDTGAQKAEVLANPKLADTVFRYEDRGGLLWIRWATALDAEYWLRTEQPFFTVSGTLKGEMPKGTATELKLVSAAGDAADAVIAAGYLDADGTSHHCGTTVQNGAVWKPVDETGATIRGDLDLDGKRTVADAVLMHRAISEELALSAAAYANADCEPDGLLTLSDVTLMLRLLNQNIEDNAREVRDDSHTGNQQTHG
jgi:hypothetical protein